MHTSYLEEVYGIARQEADAIPIEVQEILARLVWVIASADGLSASKRQHFAAWLANIGHPEALSRQLLQFDPCRADLHEMLEHFDALVARSLNEKTAKLLRHALVYEGARIATACEVYSAKERLAMEGICRTLGLSPSLQQAIETQVELELHICQARAQGLPAALLAQIDSCLCSNRRHLLAKS
jgi:hypothetical protein